ncbi:putative trichothecene biosynthesis acetyltransferase [Hypoxylon crocopeplum]|nr:putative trichothecene biosynthesis acetyltransferase [Hypoxylon crocopeplum]
MGQPIHLREQAGASNGIHVGEQQCTNNDVETYLCQPSDVNARGAKDFPLTGCDQVMPKVHARMSMYYELSNSTKQSRRDIVRVLKTGLEKLASQVPYLAASVALDPVSKRGNMRTTGDDDGVLFLVTGADTVRTDLPSYAEFERGHFAPWMLPNGKTYPQALINPVKGFQGHDGRLPACIFQVNFIEGGLILTACFHHFLVDGPSVDLLFRAWSAHCYGRDEIPLFTDRTILLSPRKLDPSEIPALERAMTARGCMVDSTKSDPDNPWSNLMAVPTKSAVISFPREAVAAMKAEIAVQKPSTQVSTADCLHAICWAGLIRAKAALTGEDYGAKDSWSVFPATFRTRSTPDFPRNFIGNSTFLNGAVVPITKLIAPGGALDAAVAVRGVIENVDAAYFADGMAWVNSIEEPATRTWMNSPPREMDAGFTSWACLRAYDGWDLGFGPPTALRPPASPIPYVFLMPTKGDTLEVVIAAAEATLKVMMEDTEFRQYATEFHLEP